ncbi:MAG: FAD-dependent oxidoreductase [Bacteroidota bacterium]
MIIGGGIFGCYAALYLARMGGSVALIEKEKELFKKASIVNQARLHGGYHYPRSVATARMSDDNKQRFTEEHRDFINFSFEKYYAIDKYSSLTDAAQFERFCRFINIKCERVFGHPLFNYERMEALYLTTEYSFDPILIGEFYKEQINTEKNIQVFNFHKIKKVEKGGGQWELIIGNIENNSWHQIKTAAVINATYSGSNAVNRQFGVGDIQLMHEISEIAFITSPALKDTGLTVMDGQFGSVMPYGKSGLLSLSSVVYTHHKVSYQNLPHFDCQEINKACTPAFSAICNFCEAKPNSNYRKMIAQMQRYYADHVQLNYLSSYFTIKSKLKANHIDDGRPTEINRLHSDPDFYCIFAGKINSIYEIEKVI